MKKKQENIETITSDEWKNLYPTLLDYKHLIVQEPKGNDLHVITMEVINNQAIESTKKKYLVKNCKPL